MTVYTNIKRLINKEFNTICSLLTEESERPNLLKCTLRKESNSSVHFLKKLRNRYMGGLIRFVIIKKL